MSNSETDSENEEQHFNPMDLLQNTSYVILRPENTSSPIVESSTISHQTIEEPINVAPIEGRINVIPVEDEIHVIPIEEEINVIPIEDNNVSPEREHNLRQPNTTTKTSVRDKVAKTTFDRKRYDALCKEYLERLTQKSRYSQYKTKKMKYMPLELPQNNVNENKNDGIEIPKQCGYSNYVQDQVAHQLFAIQVKNNSFGHACDVCENLFFEKDLRSPSASHEDLLNKLTTMPDVTKAKLCLTCKIAVDMDKIPAYSAINGFKYPVIPPHLPKLDFITERLISPRLPFLQIRRLRHIPGQLELYGQIINVPVSFDTLAKSLPRDIKNEHCIYVDMEKKVIHNNDVVRGLTRRRSIEMWLAYLMNTPLYKEQGIKIDESFITKEQSDITLEDIDEITEKIDVEQPFTTQQETLLWDEEKYLMLISKNQHSIQTTLFHDYSEELSFPSIYLGQSRNFTTRFKPSPYTIVSSEIMRKDRRGVTPLHLLYMAIKIMRLRVCGHLQLALDNGRPDFKVTKEQIKSKKYMDACLRVKFLSLQSIPNSVWHWAERKKDLFAMFRQLGRPHGFMTLRANEMEWPDLLEVLSKLQRGNKDTPIDVSELSSIQKRSLIDKDAVTCAIYFNKLVNVVMYVLKAKCYSPLGIYCVNQYFVKIGFQPGGSPVAHVLLWFDNAPNDMLENQKSAITMIDRVVYVSESEASGNIRLQTHEHNSACYEKAAINGQQCEAPFMPAKCTMILEPMDKKEENYKHYWTRYHEIRSNFEKTDYSSMNEFYKHNNIQSEEDYRCILSAGIENPMIFYRRDPSEKWYIPFNPFVLNVANASMDFRIFPDEYTCASYVVNHIIETNRKTSDLQRTIIEIMEKHPELDIGEISKKVSVDLLNSLEMTSQEAAWYLLEEPMTKCSLAIRYIDTARPNERERIKNPKNMMNDYEVYSGHVSSDYWYAKYRARPDQLEDVSLAQFVSKFNKYRSRCFQGQQRQIIRYRNYDINEDYDEYRREMVTLHLPFRDEEREILRDMRYIKTYDENEEIIYQKQQEFEYNMNTNNIVGICRELCRENEDICDNEF